MLNIKNVEFRARFWQATPFGEDRTGRIGLMRAVEHGRLVNLAVRIAWGGYNTRVSFMDLWQ